MNILITGAGGFVGSHLIPRLASCDHLTISCVYRSLKKKAPGRTRSIYLDITKDTCWSRHLQDIDVVIHLAAMLNANDKLEESIIDSNYLATQKLVSDCILAGVGRIIFLSTAGVYGKSSSELISEENNVYRPSNAYSSSKLLAENFIQETCKDSGMEFIIFRPALIYGPNNVNSLSMLKKVIDKNIPLPFSKIQNKRSFLYINNLITVIEKCLRREHIGNEIFNVADDEPISTSELINLLSPRTRPKHLNFHLPKTFMRFVMILLGQRQMYEQLYNSLHLDNSKVKRKLNIRDLKSNISVLMSPSSGGCRND